MSAAPAAAVYHSPDDVPADQVDSLLASLHASYSAAGQSHVFDFVPSLSAGEKKSLYFDLQHIQVEKVAKDFEEVLKQESAASQATPASITPFLNVSDLSSSTEEQKTAWRDLGLDLIAQGKVAAVLMAGGQGTRLGSSEPKGCYDIQLLSHKSLFQLQAERISRLRQIAADHVKVDVEKVHLRWYVMTSIVTHGATLAFFQRHSYFGLPPADCFFFQQSELPALSNTGKIMLETRSKVALAPNGNGGIFEGLKRQGALADMKQHGVEYIHVYGVDNVLALVGDPTFIGFSVSKGADCANKVVRKTRPDEKVGVMCLRGGKPSVVEYSELPQAMSVLRSDTDHQLVYSAANIVQHFFTYSFLEHHAEQPLPYHVARKAIPYVERDGTLVTPTAPSGLKLELFVFDAFERSLSMHCLAVAREEEFAPVKNAAGKGVQDSPVTARQALSDLHCERLRRAGATLVPSSGACDADAAQCEISPLVSYAGEGLQQLVQGQTIQLPYHLDPTTVKALQP